MLTLGLFRGMALRKDQKLSALVGHTEVLFSCGARAIFFLGSVGVRGICWTKLRKWGILVVLVLRLHEKDSQKLLYVYIERLVIVTQNYHRERLEAGKCISFCCIMTSVSRV